MFEYKGFFGSIEYSEEDRIFYGRIKFIRDSVSYEGENVPALKDAFEEAVDDYIEFYEQFKNPPSGDFQFTTKVE